MTFFFFSHIEQYYNINCPPWMTMHYRSDLVPDTPRLIIPPVLHPKLSPVWNISPGRDTLDLCRSRDHLVGVSRAQDRSQRPHEETGYALPPRASILSSFSSSILIISSPGSSSSGRLSPGSAVAAFPRLPVDEPIIRNCAFG